MLDLQGMSPPGGDGAEALFAFGLAQVTGRVSSH